MSITQEEIIKEFYTSNSKRNIKHPEVVDWVTAEYKKRTGKIFRDPDRAKRKLEDFSSKQKKIIFKRDNFKCVICGKGKEHVVELHIDHIKPKEFGGEAIIENGQTLCAQHNFQKKTFNQTETGKKMFIRLYELAKLQENRLLFNFCKDILETFEKHNINGHIKWEKK